MPRLIERAFNPAETVVARRFFVAAGRHYNPGDVFDWRRLAVAPRRVKQLFDNGKLMHREVAVSEASPAPLPAPPPPPPPPPTGEQELEDQRILAVAAGPADMRDELDGMNMKELREIAAAEGAPTRLRREDQRDAIREHRLARAEG